MGWRAKFQLRDDVCGRARSRDRTGPRENGIMLETYKPGHGVVVRRVAFWALVALIVWGGQSFYSWIYSYKFARTPLFGGDPNDAYLIPVLDQRFNIGFVLSWMLTLGAIFGVWKFLNRPKSGDFMIDTDSELKKVTWPSWKDAWNSSVIVLVFVALLAVFLLASDRLIQFAMDLMMGATSGA